MLIFAEQIWKCCHTYVRTGVLYRMMQWKPSVKKKKHIEDGTTSSWLGVWTNLRSIDDVLSNWNLKTKAFVATVSCWRRLHSQNILFYNVPNLTCRLIRANLYSIPQNPKASTPKFAPPRVSTFWRCVKTTISGIATNNSRMNKQRLTSVKEIHVRFVVSPYHYEP